MMKQMSPRPFTGPRNHYLPRSNVDLSREKPVSRLVILQARFQQKQLHEKEAKLMQLYEEQQERQERALQRVKGPWNPPAASQGTYAAGVGQPARAGKVRSLLQYRRDHGRDKSYPLEPILPPSQTDKNPTRKPRTQSLEPRRTVNQTKQRQNVLYFGGSHQDLQFSDELDYGQSFQVIDDQLIYDPVLHAESDDSGDFHVKSFNNKRQFYEKHFSGVSEESLSDIYQPKTFQRLPNVGLDGSQKMSQKIESASKNKTYVTGKSTISAGTPPRSALPTRQNIVKKASALPPQRPRLGLDSPPTRSSPEPLTNGLKNLRIDSPTNSNGTPPRLNGAGSPPLKALNGGITKNTPGQTPRATKADQVIPPVPASRTTAPRPSSSSSSSAATKKSVPKPSAPANGLTPCRHCGRSFAPDRVDKHETICQKSTIKKRKVFDPVKARVEGTEAAKYVLTGLSAKNAKQAEKKVAGKSNWRQKHEEFINNIRAAKEVKEHLRKGGKLSDLPPPPPSDYSDYVQCPHCQRKFNETAASRHIPKCATMLHNKPQPAKRPAAPLKSTSTFRKK